MLDVGWAGLADVRDAYFGIGLAILDNKGASVSRRNLYRRYICHHNNCHNDGIDTIDKAFCRPHRAA